MEYYKIICWSECPFCIKAKALMIEKGLQFEYCSIDHSRELLDYYKKTFCHSMKSSYLGILIGFSTVVSMRTIM